MKSALPWVLVVILTGLVYLLYSANKTTEAELQRSGQDSQEVENLRKENAELKKLPDQQNEIARLRKDNEEVVQLRGEIQRLHEEAKQLKTQLTAAQAQTAQAQQAQQQLSQLATENQALRNQTQRIQQAQSMTQAAQQINACVNNLRQIDGAKQQWALENRKTADAVPSAADLSPYLGRSGNPSQLVCPAGGTYSINALNVPPTCSIPGHVLQ